MRDTKDLRRQIYRQRIFRWHMALFHLGITPNTAESTSIYQEAMNNENHGLHHVVTKMWRSAGREMAWKPPEDRPTRFLKVEL